MKEKILMIVCMLFLLIGTSKARNVAIEDKIEGLYIGYFKRAADKKGLDYWNKQASGGNSLLVLNKLSEGFSNHPTFSTTYGHLSNQEFVEAIYKNVLGKDGDSTGIAYWVQQLDQDKSRSDVVSDFIKSSLEGDLAHLDLTPAELEVAQQRQDLITNKVLVAKNFTTLLSQYSNVTNELSPESDPAYLASINILSCVNEDPSTATAKINYLQSIKNSNNPIADINNEAGNINWCSGETNNTPVANAITTRTNEETAIEITLNGSDSDDDDLTYIIVTNPVHGTVTINTPTNNKAIYIPKADYSGNDTFTYKVNDGTIDSNIATVSIDVIADPVNHLPVASTISVDVQKNTAKKITLLANDIDGDDLTYSIVTSPSSGSIDLENNIVTYTPADNYAGHDSFTYKTNDGSVDSNTAKVSIIISVNHAPIASSISTSTTVSTAKDIMLIGSDTDKDRLTYIIVTTPTHGSVIQLLSHDLVTYYPENDYNGSDSFSYKVNDGIVDSGIATVTINIGSNSNPINGTSAITGIVKESSSNNILANVRVKLYHDANFLMEVLTDSTGTYRFENLIEKSGYFILLTKNNYLPGNYNGIETKSNEVAQLKTIFLEADTSENKVISGSVKTNNGVAVSGVSVKFEYLLNGVESSTTAITNLSGDYEIKVDSSYFDGNSNATYLIYAYKERYVSSTKTLKINSTNNYPIDFIINPIKVNEVILEIEPVVHHLGDNKHGGVGVNSQFQKTTEGTKFNIKFNISSLQYDNYKKAILRFEAKGIQPGNFYNNLLLVNGNSYPLLGSPSDGSYKRHTIELDKDNYHEGNNSLEITSGFYGDYDDFEFSNIVLEFIN